MSNGAIAYLVLVVCGFAGFMAALAYGWLQTKPWRAGVTAAPPLAQVREPA
jgi:hypothetical protein